jgi:hypothetical protein
MEERAQELYESWVNGNLSFVVEEVTHHGKRLRRSCEAALLACYLTEAMKPKERAVFFRMLRDRT